MDQSRFFHAGDDARTDSRFTFEPRQKFAAISCFARRARGGRQNLVNPVRVGSRLNFDNA
jgi:hypothetical protein